jgi:hypothetical protein
VVLWLTPSGEQFWKVGYEPDVTVRLYDPINRILPEDGGSLDLGGVAAGNDTQLEAAVDMLSTAIVRR